MKLKIIAFAGICSFACHGQSANISADKGVLMFSGGKDGRYTSVKFKNEQGNVLNIFDEGLIFNYRKSSSRYLSPDKKYAFMKISEGGELSDESGISGESSSHTEYMCAFVRMESGCVETIETGQVCGGKWDSSGAWIGLDGASFAPINYVKPTVEKLFKIYSADKNSSPVTSPKINKYLLEGTGFDNIMACDPVNESNKISYEGLLKLLERDKDEVDAGKVKSALKGVKDRLINPSLPLQ